MFAQGLMWEVLFLACMFCGLHTSWPCTQIWCTLWGLRHRSEIWARSQKNSSAWYLTMGIYISTFIAIVFDPNLHGHSEEFNLYIPVLTSVLLWECTTPCSQIQARKVWCSLSCCEVGTNVSGKLCLEDSYQQHFLVKLRSEFMIREV